MLAEREKRPVEPQQIELHASLAYTENIIATLREPFVVLDKSMRVRTANASFYRAFHASTEKTEGRSLFELGNGQWDIPGLRGLLTQVLSNSDAVEDFEVSASIPNIGRRALLLNARRFPPEGDNPQLILLSFEDVTERRKAETSLKESEVQFRRLFQTAKDGILILDANTGKVIDANPFMSGLLGYERDEFMGKELWEIGVFRDAEASRTAFRKLQAEGYVRYDQLPLVTKNAREVQVEFVSNVYMVNQKKVAQCNIRDISERRRLEQEIERHTAALVDLHRRKDEFLAMLSHELRSPLAPILNAVHILRLQGNETPHQLHARNIIERQVGQLAHLVDDLLEISRITTGRIHLQRDRVDLRGVVEHALEAVHSLIERRKHEFSLSLPAEPIWLHADPTRLEQVVVNLLTNATKYTDEGGRIWLSVRQEGDAVVLRVRDTGVGIAPELLPRIFDLFTQADRSLDRSQGGLGIGLCLVQRLVELHGGTVEGHSPGLGQGSEFIVRLPVLPSPATPPQSTSPVPVEQPAHGGRVLVVDDNVAGAESLALLLRMSGHDVRTAYTGPAALEAAVAYLPNIVMLDIGLPGLNGYEVARRLRTMSQLKDVRLIALTGYGSESDIRLSLEAGFNSHMVKPVDLAKVQAHLMQEGR